MFLKVLFPADGLGGDGGEWGGRYCRSAWCRLPGMKPILFLLLVLAGAPVSAASAAGAAHTPAAARGVVSSAEVDSATMERELQRLPWTQFRSVVEAVPKLKAGIDAYGPAGWQFVQANYRNYGWKKNIDRLDEGQKKQLAELIRRAKSGK